MPILHAFFTADAPLARFDFASQADQTRMEHLEYDYCKYDYLKKHTINAGAIFRLVASSMAPQSPVLPKISFYHFSLNFHPNTTACSTLHCTFT